MCLPVEFSCDSTYMTFFFFFNDTATTEIYTLSLHDALPISPAARGPRPRPRARRDHNRLTAARSSDRKSTRLNSSHSQISYAVFCLKKKKKNKRYKLPTYGQRYTHLQQGPTNLTEVHTASMN